MTVDQDPEVPPPADDAARRAEGQRLLGMAIGSWPNWFRLTLLIVVIGLLIFGTIYFLHVDVTIGPLRIVGGTRIGEKS